MAKSYRGGRISGLRVPGITGLPFVPDLDNASVGIILYFNPYAGRIRVLFFKTNDKD